MDNYFHYFNSQLYAENVLIEKIISTVGTPCYIYSRNAIEQNWKNFQSAFGKYPHLICYAVKANSNLAVLNILARLGSGFDIVSVGELERVIAAGGNPNSIVFSGVGKKISELERALDVGIYCFNVESEMELSFLEQVAIKKGRKAPISLRINPDIDTSTHPYITTGLKQNKFGIELEQVLTLYKIAASSPHFNILGIDCHIGSQLTNITPFINALKRILVIAQELEKIGIHIAHLDLGGGLGICYKDETPPSPKEYINSLLSYLKPFNYKLLVEPGRAIVGNAGILVTRVELIKIGNYKNFVIIDAAMNDLLRPALYSAWQRIIPIKLHTNVVKRFYDIVGPICETSDFIGYNRELSIKPGDNLAICSAGAYGFSMSSNYNSRPRIPEVIVDGPYFKIVRKREKINDLYSGESLFF